MSTEQSNADRSPQDIAKEAAGRHAASYVTDGMRVGLGTGSTVHWTIVELGERALDIVCTSTSVQTHELATFHECHDQPNQLHDGSTRFAP